MDHELAQETTRRGNQKMAKKPIKNIILLILIFIIMYNFYSFSGLFNIKIINIVLTLALLPLYIAVLYLTVDFFKKKKKLYIGTIIWILIYGIGSLPFFFLANATNPITNIVINDSPVNIAICGTDTREGEGDITTSSRCDSVSIINVDGDQLNMISVPRDAYVYDTCTQSYDKLTHTSLEGMECYTSALEETFNTTIDSYVKVNFLSVIDIIDSIGGVDIVSDATFYGQDEYDNDDAYYFEEGLSMHLNGSQALSYARERKSFSDGDYTRALHQQQIINAVFSNIKSSGIKSAMALATKSSSLVDTNLDIATLTSLATKIISSDEITKNSMVVQGYGQSADLPSRDLYGVSVQMLDEQSVNEASAILNHTN